jgi:hypothetical protein
MIKYKACAGSYPTIEKIEITRETVKCVWIKTTGWKGELQEEKLLKENSWRPIFDTWELAHNHIVSKAIESMESAQKKLQYAEADYKKAINMKES